MVTIISYLGLLSGSIVLTLGIYLFLVKIKLI